MYSRFNLQAISSVSSIFNLQVHFKSFENFFTLFGITYFWFFIVFRRNLENIFYYFFPIKYEIVLKKWEAQYYYRWSRQKSQSRLTWQLIQQLKQLQLYSIRELEVSVLGVSLLYAKILTFPPVIRPTSATYAAFAPPQRKLPIFYLLSPKLYRAHHTGISLNHKTQLDRHTFRNLGLNLIRCNFSERSLCKTNISSVGKTWVKLRRWRLADSTWGKMPSILQGLYFLHLLIILDQSHGQ